MSDIYYLLAEVVLLIVFDDLVNTNQTRSLPYKVIAISVKSSTIKYAVTVNFKILGEALNKHLIHGPQLQQHRVHPF